MRRSSVALISLIGPLILGACTDRDSTAPRGITPGQPNAALLVPAATCDPTAIKAAQTAYFTSKTDSSGVYIAELKKAYGAGDYSTANTVVYKIGRLVAKERLTPATSTDASVGGIFLIDVLRCLTDLSALPTVVAEDISEFVPNATSVVKSGIWEIRGGTTNATVPAAGRVIDNTSHVRAFGEPRWGVELGTVSSWGTDQYVVFGFPITSNVIIGSPANINTNEVEASAFELGTIPAGTSKTGLRVGVCIPYKGTGTANRIVHNTSEILDLSDLTALCDTSDPNFVASVAAPDSWYASFLHRAGSLLSPKEAFAQTSGDCSFLLCTGGLPSDWSPFTADGILASTMTLSYTPQLLTNITVGQYQVINFHAFIPGTPAVNVPGVLVTISIAGNSGQPGGATFSTTDPTNVISNNGTTISAKTDANGVASITFAIGKAGGYTLTTAGSIDGFPVGTPPVNTTVFVKNP